MSTWVLDPFRSEHLDGFEPQEAQADADLSWIEDADSVIVAGRVVAIIGYVDMGCSTARAWAVIARGAPMRIVTLAARKMLVETTFRRVEIKTDVDFPQAQKWAEMLGFQFEGVMRCAGPNGEDCALFARIQWPQLS